MNHSQSRCSSKSLPIITFGCPLLICL